MKDWPDNCKDWPDNCVDLVFCSPPYEDARTYGIDFKLKGQEWVDWALPRFIECVRVCKGLVCWVVEGKTKQFRWSATPVLLMADLHRAGIKLRKPPAFHRVGIPGSGGPDWLRNDYEFIICSSKGKLPWSDNTAMGHPPKWKPGGDMSNRLRTGERVSVVTRNRTKAGKRERRGYFLPKIANPGNVIDCGVGGGGNIGDKLAHENEAPFPESLVEFFIKSFCPPGGIVLDPFCGSGTTCAVADRFGRKWIGIDKRQSQVELSEKRIDKSKEKYALLEGTE
jgi:hypothetical protein